MTMPKYERYQDSVIKDGRLVGEFDQMYQDHDDPWEQTIREKFSSEKAIALNWCEKLNDSCADPLKVIELGCGLGLFTNKLAKHGFNVLGTDVSETAIQKAQNKHVSCQFKTADILDFHIYDEFRPDVFVMAEITWYVLEKLDSFLNYLRSEFKGCYLIHLLTTYPEGVQQYGKNYFGNLKEIMSYYKLNYIEFGETTYNELDGCKRTYFLAQL